ncbi:hypothetical protein [Capnocytophaga granulosa]
MFFSLNDIFNGLVSGIKSIQSDNNESSTQDEHKDKDNIFERGREKFDIELKDLDLENSTSEGEVFFFDDLLKIFGKNTHSNKNHS